MRPLEGVRDLRERRMLTQQELAERADVSLFTVQRIERGEGNVRPKTGRAIAAALGVGVEDLLEVAQAPLWSDENPEELPVSWDKVLRQSLEDARRAMDEGASLDELSPEQRDWLQNKLVEMDMWHYGMGTQDMSVQERSVTAARKLQAARVKKAKKIGPIRSINIQTRGIGSRNKKRERQ